MVCFLGCELQCYAWVREMHYTERGLVDDTWGKPGEGTIRLLDIIHTPIYPVSSTAHSMPRMQRLLTYIWHAEVLLMT